ncbi:MAG: hypothetical protein JWO82_4010 [Akkermansiaceae bacterium]|nr:hypothetical protein [Akkermansiaceae bacterium]
MISSPRTSAVLLSLGLVLASPLHGQSTVSLESADANRDGFVTKAELLSAYFAKTPGSTAEVRAAFADSTLERLDANKDGKLSKDEIAAGVPKPGTVMVEKGNPDTARIIMAALAEYRKSHAGVPAQTLNDLSKDGLVPAAALLCTLANGQKSPWTYTPAGQKPLDLDAVLLYSPGPVDAAGHLIIGMGDGKVLVAKTTDLDMRKAPIVRVNGVRTH